jgi:hypothetical protein
MQAEFQGVFEQMKEQGARNGEGRGEQGTDEQGTRTGILNIEY